jgi:peptide/nickel transport system substrate-binding protein
VSTYGTAKGDVDSIAWNLPYGEPNTIDPPNTAFYSSAMVAMNLCEPLTRLNADYSTSDNLAVLTRPDDRTLVYDIKAGVKFWNGATLTSQDVVWSLDHARDPSSITSFLFSNVASITASGPLQVTIKLSAPDSLLPIELATFAGAIQEKAFSVKAGKALGTPTVGVMCTGPLAFKNWTPGQQISLVRNDSYWDPARKARTKTASLSFTTDSNSLAQALSTGQYDGAYEVPAATIPTLTKASSGSMVFGGPSQLYLALATTSTKGALADADVRKALFMTVDRAAIAKAVYSGAAEANWTVLNQDSWRNANTPADAQKVWQDAYAGFQQERSSWGSTSAVTAAKELATKGGYNGQPIVIATLAGDATLSQVAQYVQAQAKQAGLNVQIKDLQAIDYSNAQVDPAARAGLDMILYVSFNAAPSPLEPLLFYFLPDSFYNFTGYNDPAVTKAIQEARVTSDQAAQARLLTQAQVKYEDAYLLNALVQLDELVFLNKRLGGATTSFAYMNMTSLSTIGSGA